MGKLILVRHGITSWNKAGRWQGKTDVPLSEEGKRQIDQTDEVLRGVAIDQVFTSTLARVKQSQWVIMNDLKLDCPVTETPALDERDYGEYTGMNKWDFEAKYGEEVFERVRRGYRTPIPGGETLEEVFLRVTAFFKEAILPLVMAGKNVLVVSSGNTLRAMIKLLDDLTDEEVEKLEIGFAAVISYEIDGSGKVTSREILSAGIDASKPGK